LARARADGKTFGRQRIGADKEAAIRAARRQGTGIRRIATNLRVGVSVVQRVLNARRA
jgi:DNA invertase Pin-like site-specific DNA recombinase